MFEASERGDIGNALPDWRTGSRSAADFPEPRLGLCKDRWLRSGHQQGGGKAASRKDESRSFDHKPCLARCVLTTVNGKRKSGDLARLDCESGRAKRAIDAD